MSSTSSTSTLHVSYEKELIGDRFAVTNLQDEGRQTSDVDHVRDDKWKTDYKEDQREDGVADDCFPAAEYLMAAGRGKWTKTKSTKLNSARI